MGILKSKIKSWSLPQLLLLLLLLLLIIDYCIIIAINAHYNYSV